MRKTVIQVWTTECIEEFPGVPNWANQSGLGDLVRGAVGLYKLCAQKGYEFIVDISLHPVSEYLQQKPHRFSQLVQENKDTIMGVFHERLPQFLEQALAQKDQALCHAISWQTIYDEPAEPELKEFIKSILTPLVPHITPLPFPNYRIVHFRVGDDELVLDKAPDSYDAFLQLFEPSTEPTLVLSDSRALKQLLKSMHDVHILTHNIAHVGKHTDTDAIQNTMAEFFLTMRATHIQSYTVYSWTSGFVKIANYIYDIPLRSKELVGSKSVSE